MLQTPRKQLRQTAVIQSGAHRLETFARELLGITLRPYQLEAAQAVIESIRAGAGRSIVIMFARQSGKDELCADLKAYLLARFQTREVGIVEVNPTYKPQTINAMARLEERLERSTATQGSWRKRSDFIRKLGRARVTFLSGDATAKVMGAVASLLLIVNEAQDVAPAVYDRNFAPMAASTNATRLFMGTAWTRHTLLARELRAAREAERQDGVRRVFVYDAEDVSKVVPAYGEYLRDQVARLGRGHPLIKTQYFNEEIDAEGSMFTPARRAMMECRASEPQASSGAYVFAIDVAGQDEAAFHDPEAQLLTNPGRDAVSLTIASVAFGPLGAIHGPVFRVVERQQWTGLNHLQVFARLQSLADQWNPRHIVIDATGVGEGLWAMLDRQYPTRVLPVKFSAQKKSDLGYRFLAMIETGRFRDCSFHDVVARRATPDEAISLSNVSRAMVDRQYAACTSEVLLGPQHLMRWGVPEGTRDTSGGALIHDDIVMADALLAEADLLDWTFSSGPALIIEPKDPLEEMSHYG